MKEIPILFRAEMIRALLNTKVGSWPPEPIDPALPFKWQTRRPVKPAPKNSVLHSSENGKWYDADCKDPGIELKPRWEKGDHLWVKETFWGTEPFYRADPDPTYSPVMKWRPCIFMPRKLCRIELELMQPPKPERVNEITGRDAKAEGVRRNALWSNYKSPDQYKNAFRRFYDEIHGEGTFDKGEWVWRLAFKRIK